MLVEHTRCFWQASIECYRHFTEYNNQQYIHFTITNIHCNSHLINPGLYLILTGFGLKCKVIPYRVRFSTEHFANASSMLTRGRMAAVTHQEINIRRLKQFHTVLSRSQLLTGLLK